MDRYFDCLNTAYDNPTLAIGLDCYANFDGSPEEMTDILRSGHPLSWPNDINSMSLAYSGMNGTPSEAPTSNLLEVESGLEYSVEPGAASLPFEHDTDLTTSVMPSVPIHSMTIVSHRGPKQPTPQHWESWRPMIMAKYKHATAQMIINEIRSSGFYVT